MQSPKNNKERKNIMSGNKPGYFEFRIIDLSDSRQVIDTTLRTPYDALTPIQMAEYIEVYTQLDYMDRMKRKAQREAERQRKLSRSLLYRAACLFGIA